jgi:hypothetical protein
MLGDLTSRGWSVILFAVGVFIILATRPQFLIDEDGNWKSFGIGEGKSCVCLTTLIVVWALLSFLFANVITSFFQRRILPTQSGRNNGGGTPAESVFDFDFDNN